MAVGSSNYPTSLDTPVELVEAANNAADQLSGNIDASVTTIPVMDATEFAASGIVAIDAELLSYTGKAGNSLTGAVRGIEGTTAASHTDMTAVRQVITAASHNVQSAAIIALETKLGTGTDIAWSKMASLTSNRVIVSDGTGDIAASPITHDSANAVVGNVGGIDFDTTPSGANAAARLIWDDTDGTLAVTLKGGNVLLPIGQRDTARVVNKTGSNLLASNYQVVRISQAQGQRLGVSLAQGNSEPNSTDVLGLVAENISVNQEGFVVSRGLVTGINTTGSLQGETWADGDILYLSPTTAGGLTKTEPQAPNHLIIAGYVVYAHQNNGKIFVAIQTSWEVAELHDVKITGTPAAGSLLIRNATSGIWENATLTAGSNITITNADKSITINSTASGSGDVVGPASSTNNAVARFDGITGKLLKNTSTVTLSDAGAFSFPDGVRQTFNPNGTSAGINVGAHTSDPSTPANGDLWYNSASGVDQLRTRRGGATENVATIPATIGDEIPVMSGNLTATGELLWDSVLNGVQIGNVGTGVLTLAYAGGLNGISLTPPSTGGLVSLTLPAGTGSNGQALTTNGAGVTAWSTVVTSVTGTAPVTSSGGATPAISLSSGYGDTLNPYASKTQNTFLAAPNGSAGTPSFRSIATADLPAINLASGVTGVLPIANGGTNASTVSQARINLLPSYTGNALRVLRLNFGETDVEWATVSASPGGSNTQIQFNNSGAFGGNEGLVYNTSTASRDVTVSSFAGISSFIAQRAEGTSTSPTAVQGSALTAGQVGRLDFLAYNGSTYEQAATIRVQPGATFDTSNGGKGIMYLAVKPANRASGTEMGAIALECRTASSQAVNLYPISSGALGNSTFPWEGLHLRPSITLYNNSNSNTITLTSSVPSSSYTLTLPTSTGTNGQVLTTNGSGVLSWAAGGGNSGGMAFKNVLHNGEFRVAQRGTGPFTSVTTFTSNDGTYQLDRWYTLTEDASGVVAVSQTTDVPAGRLNSIGLQIKTANRKFGIAQIIEQSYGVHLTGMATSLSFKMRVTNATKLNNVKAAVFAWTGPTDAVTRDLVSSWGAGGTTPTWAANLTVENTISTFTPTTSWATYKSENFTIDTAGMKNIVVFIWSDVKDTTVDDWLYITDVQLEMGAAATDFECVPLDIEQNRCERYLLVNGWKLVTASDGPRMFGGFTNLSTVTIGGVSGFYNVACYVDARVNLRSAMTGVTVVGTLTTDSSTTWNVFENATQSAWLVGQITFAIGGFNSGAIDAKVRINATTAPTTLGGFCTLYPTVAGNRLVFTGAEL
jgi:hypothetical protein